jgi:hypothetical protein
VGKGAAPLLGQLGVEMAGGFFSFFFFFFSLSLVLCPSITSGSSDVVSPGDWLVRQASILLLLSRRQVGIGT